MIQACILLLQDLSLSYWGLLKAKRPILLAKWPTFLAKHIDVCRTSHIDGIFRQFIHSGEIACEPMSVGKIETIAPGLEKGLTRF